MTREALPLATPDVASQVRPVLRDVAEKIARHRGSAIGEQNTKLTLINPVLRALGWDVEDLEHVRHEFRRRPQDKPVDYALMLRRTPKLFMEAKALDENLVDPRWSNQIVSYATVAGVEWVVLTNGDEYRVYNAHAPVPVEEKLFRAVLVSDDVDAAVECLALISKDEIERDSLAAIWRTDSIDRRVRQAIEALFVPEPAPWLVRRLAKEVEELSAGDVRASLARARITLDFPSEAVAGPDATHSGRQIAKRRQRRLPIPKAVSAVSVQDLIQSGLIKPPLDLVKTYLGKELSGRIEQDGRVSLGGETYSSVSTAAAMARRSIVGAPPGRKYPHTNGWTFWRFRDADGSLRKLNVLRERFVHEHGGGRS